MAWFLNNEWCFKRGNIVDNALAESNMNFTGAMAILNIGQFPTIFRSIPELKS